MKRINPYVFYPPLVLILCTILLSQFNNDLFESVITGGNRWILENFGGLFSWASFLFLPLLLITYFSPLGRRKIGGAHAEPLLSKARWFAISICTTIATGILFWGCAEPLYHYALPPIEGMAATSEASAQFSMATMFLHWSFTPYGIYCLAGLVFALSFYNEKKAYSVSSMLGWNLKKKQQAVRISVDVICLYALVLGMSASLGAGIYAIIGGIEKIFAIPKSNFLIAIVGSIIIASFILSAISGLQKGIKWLSTINIIGFILLAIFIVICGYPLEIAQSTFAGLGEYFLTFPERSTNIASGIQTEWLYDWSIFYWANWFAWAPIAALFLGRIARGYTVREYIHFNLFFPSLFAIIWMSIFSGSTLHINQLADNALYETMTKLGAESVMYELLEDIGFSAISIPITLFLIFLSYVTAADSNISAMSLMSEQKQSDEKAEASIIVKVIWGLVIGTLTYIMLSTKGLDGIRILSVLGGFPAMFIIIAAAFNLLRMSYRSFYRSP